MTTVTNYGDAEPTAQEQRIADLEQQIEAMRATAAGSDTKAVIDATLRSLQYAAPENKPALLFHKLIAPLQAKIGDAEQTIAAYAAEAAELEEQVRNLRIIDAAQRATLQRVSADRNSLRAAVDTYAVDLARVSAERDQLRRQLTEAKANAAPREEIAQLYDAYAYATAGWEPGKAERFPAVLRYLFDTQGAE